MHLVPSGRCGCGSFLGGLGGLLRRVLSGSLVDLLSPLGCRGLVLRIYRAEVVRLCIGPGLGVSAADRLADTIFGAKMRASVLSRPSPGVGGYGLRLPALEGREGPMVGLEEGGSLGCRSVSLSLMSA